MLTQIDKRKREEKQISVSQMTMDMFHLSKTLPGPFLIHGLSPSL
jgi:hypothetical protein